MKKLTGWILIVALVSGCTNAATEYRKEIAEPQKPAVTSTISVLAWNIESGGNDPDVISAQLRELSGHDIYCLSEVAEKNLDRYTAAFGSRFQSLNSRSGRNDHLQISFDSDRFELLETDELMEYRDFVLNDGRHRSPIFVRLKDRSSGTEFIVMTNHLARRNAKLRKQQAIGLREWARDQNVAVINVGDFNLDYDFHTKSGNSAFPEMLRDNIWSWVEPKPLIDTNWSDRDNDGIDNYPDSMLDFAFVAAQAKTWNPTCQVIVREGDFPDDETTSDHRPIELRMTPE